MGTSEEGLEGVVRAARALVHEAVPEIGRTGTTLAPAFERRIWPRGGPAVATWAVVFEGARAYLDALTDGLVRADIAAAGGRSAPPGGSVVRASTAAHVQRHQQLKDRMEAEPSSSMLDEVLFPAGEPAPERLSLAQLVDASAALVLDVERSADSLDDPKQRCDLASLLLHLVAELALHVRGIAGLTESAEARARMNETMQRAMALQAQLPT